ncbi:hypothetical protein H3146_11255 [Streptomyces sp. OF3]|uniref:DUF6194 domain-containing protein n=1 Tax=Streptomyces alkaliterrae TaxID=2213162 RepID=A0A5P0YLQ4_9ACTN|nr:DUF6194 family protein [Streptomyces alkaliterrae]MBB1253937.1 hypothetical protein [Streptomyces alkaliterrae]MBB1260069.1 hypothetical protein [Streptomyces alkaliterrae]MQS01226.1 hypothetical protein [Streptomyces alkaliterrae]
MEQIISAVEELDGALVLRPEPDGDAYLYHAPDGRPPRTGQPYGTITTADQPGDTASHLDAPDRWRVNVHVDRGIFEALTGETPSALTRPRDHTAVDTVLPHPVYGTAGWICVVNPGPRTADTVTRLLRDAHERARARHQRRQRLSPGR